MLIFLTGRGSTTSVSWQPIRKMKGIFNGLVADADLILIQWCFDIIIMYKGFYNIVQTFTNTKEINLSVTAFGLNLMT